METVERLDVGAASSVSVAAENTDTAICPFRVTIPETELIALRHRIAATRWEQPTVFVSELRAAFRPLR